MHLQQLSARVGVWVDGVVMLKVGEYNAKNIAHLLSIGRHQLLKEERHSVHLSPVLSPRTAQDILEWVDQALPPTADDRTVPTMPCLARAFSHARPELRLSLMIDFYMALRHIGTRTDVQFEVASQIFDRFRNEWRTMDAIALEGLRDAIRSVRRIFYREGWDLLHDPVIMMVAHTFAYGMQHGMFTDLHLVERVLSGSSVLRGFIERVGSVRYMIRSFVATPAIYPLPVRRRAPRKIEESQRSGLGLRSLAPSDVSSLGGDIFPFGEYPAASPPHWTLNSTISVEDFRDMGLNGWVLLAGVQEWEVDGGGDGGGDEDEVMEEAEVPMEGDEKGIVDVQGATQSLGAMSL
jgi:hypothetical protein